MIATQKEQIRADRDADVAALERALDALINDGSAANDAEATAQYTPLIQGVRNDARAELQALDAQERELTLANTETKLQANQEQVTAVKFDPLYVWVAGWFMPDQSDASLRVVAQRIGAFWAFLIEFIAGAGPAMLYAAHSHFSDRRAAEAKNLEASERAKKGWVTRKEKATANEDGLQIEDKGYWTSRIVKALNRHPNGMKKRTVKGMCDTYFGEIPPAELREHLKRQIDGHLELPKADPKKQKYAIERGLLSDERKTYLMQEHIDFIFIEGEYAPQEEPEQEVNGKDHSTELTIPELGADDANRPQA